MSIFGVHLLMKYPSDYLDNIINLRYTPGLVTEINDPEPLKVEFLYEYLLIQTGWNVINLFFF